MASSPQALGFFSGPAPRAWDKPPSLVVAWCCPLLNFKDLRGVLGRREVCTAETTYTYRPSDAVAGQASHGDDARAGRSPWHGGLGEVLPGTLGLRVVQFLPIRPHRRTRLLRPGSTVSAVADQRGGLAQSSWARRLARVAGHHPQPPGSRFAYAPWSLPRRGRAPCFNPPANTS